MKIKGKLRNDLIVSRFLAISINKLILHKVYLAISQLQESMGSSTIPWDSLQYNGTMTNI